MELLVTYILIALVISFLCSIAESVLLSITMSFVETEKKKGRRSGVVLSDLKSNIERPLTAILTLNTIAHTMGATGAGAQYKALYGGTGEAIFAAGLTLAILIGSELIPKSLGARYWRVLAIPVAYCLLPADRLLRPFIRRKHQIVRVSREELEAMAMMGRESGDLGVQELHILRNLLRFRSSKVRDIMTPRTVVYALPETLTVDEFVDQAVTKPFSRIPVYRKNSDDITGFVLKGDVLQSRILQPEMQDLKRFKRPIRAVPSSASIAILFAALIEEKQHLMLVVDEFGGVEGVVTLEDVVETLLGLEIVDEADREVDMQKVARRLWQKRARAMGLEVGDGESTDTKPPGNREKGK